MSSIKRIALTTGDLDGIGLEVTIKALEKLPALKQAQVFIFVGSNRELSYHNSKVRSLYKKQLIQLHKVLAKKSLLFSSESLDEALEQSRVFKKSAVWIISSDKNPAVWVEESAKAAFYKKIDGIVTGPLSKTLIQRDGLKDMGHTDILKRVTKSKSAYMSFWGSHFNVVLASGHLEVSKIQKTFNSRNLESCIIETKSVCKKLGLKKDIALLGLNPHAGEKGLIGRSELKLDGFLKKKSGVHRQFLVPDVAFQRPNWKRFSAFICAYHDQGLIPFKMIHGQQSGAHLTLGIPIIRTSVDHGTAKDLFGHNKATPNSMIDAIKLCIKLSKAKRG